MRPLLSKVTQGSLLLRTATIFRLGNYRRWPQLRGLCQSSQNNYEIAHNPASASTKDEVGKLYRETYRRSIENPEEYWGQIAEGIVWSKRFNRVLDTSNPPFTNWFPGGELNVCYNAVDRHVDEGRGEQTALIYDSPMTKTVQKFTYAELQDKISKLSRLLVSMGLGKGDRVLIYLPMIPEAVIAMLAAARIGAPHSVVFGGFAAKELAKRIAHAEPKVILSANCGIEPSRIVHYKPILDEAINLSKKENLKCVIYNRKDYPRADMKSGRDVDWTEALDKITTGHDSVPVKSNHPLYILYTSGTTGMPKGVVRSSGGHAVVLKWSLKTIFGMDGPGDVWWAASDLGWVVGHSYICYAPLLTGLTSILYEGKPVGTPDAAQFYRVIDEHKVNGMFTAPTALRAIKRDDPENTESQQYSRKSLRYLFAAGEHLDMESRIWAQNSFKVPVLDNWWQTETGHPIAATCVGLGNGLNPPEHSCGLALPGYQLEVVRESGEKANPGELGRIVCKLPTPPGFMDTLYNGDDQYKDAYFTRFPGYYDSADAGVMDDKGYVYVMARDDDVINVAGHRISTSALEEIMLEHPLVTDAAVIGVPDSLKGQLPLALYVLKPGHDGKISEEQMKNELIQQVRKSMGPVAAFKLAVCVPALPRTRSGKTPRKSISDLAQDKVVQIPPTIEDASVYEQILLALQRIGYAKNASFKK